MTHVVNNMERALKLVRVGGIICIENTLSHGLVADETAQDEETKAIRELNRRLREDKRIEMVMLGISDGVTLCVRRE